MIALTAALSFNWLAPFFFTQIPTCAPSMPSVLPLCQRWAIDWYACPPSKYRPVLCWYSHLFVLLSHLIGYPIGAPHSWRACLSDGKLYNHWCHPILLPYYPFILFLYLQSSFNSSFAPAVGDFHHRPDDRHKNNNHSNNNNAYSAVIFNLPILVVESIVHWQRIPLGDHSLEANSFAPASTCWLRISFLWSPNLNSLSLSFP